MYIIYLFTYAGLRVNETRGELEQFLIFIKEIQSLTGELPVIILESTSHYHTPIIQWLVENQIPYVLLISHYFLSDKAIELRKVKTDAFDAYQLGILYYKEEFEPHNTRELQLLNLRNLARQQEIITNMHVEAKLNFHTILGQVFPEYRGDLGFYFHKYH
ncbi:IS110 family transposase [Cytobacillus purgationiresistens]|uniref:Transposase IS110-like N-terminal domain-containing protein n=1 Tax=Cytobacillus purgationiresistens TaxID=863449 RepID=A0ABU0AGN2_9BACI|nr:hypothetical protein [Cytobacillus purgationiresistens]